MNLKVLYLEIRIIVRQAREPQLVRRNSRFEFSAQQISN